MLSTLVPTTQCAAVSTYDGAIRLPPQNCRFRFPDASAKPIAATNGYLPSGTEMPRTTSDVICRRLRRAASLESGDTVATRVDTIVAITISRASISAGRRLTGFSRSWPKGNDDLY